MTATSDIATCISRLPRRNRRASFPCPGQDRAADVLLLCQFKNLIEVLIVLLSIPFALVGSVWLLWLLDHRISHRPAS
ncbi:MAG TPA: hypothetical protein VHN14_21800 [Kofleriaceae bacterium]|nr:hypothetical protein [Kofleriaceae bacterium]